MMWVAIGYGLGVLSVLLALCGLAVLDLRSEIDAEREEPKR